MAHPFLTIRTGPELKAALAARAEKEGRTVSNLAVRVLEAAANRWNNKAPGAGTPSATSTAVRSESTNATQPHRRRAGKSAAD